jgi:hypothetical protein
MIAMRESLRRDLSRSANSIAQVNLFPPRFVLLSLAFRIIENKQNSVRHALLSAAAIASRKCECSCRAMQTVPLKLRLL